MDALDGMAEKQQQLIEAIKQQDISTVKSLLDGGVDIECKPTYGRECTPIHVAAEVGFVPVLRLLRQNGADIHAKDKVGKIVSHYAAKGGNIEALAYLQGLGISLVAVDGGGDTPAHLAALYGHITTLEFLHSHNVQLDAPNLYKYTPLHYAALSGHVEVLRFLHSTNARLDTHGDWGNTPAHYAAIYGHVEVLKFLHSSNIQLDILNRAGRTPLHDACYSGHTNAALYLLEIGCASNTVNKYGQTAVQLLQKRVTLVSDSERPKFQKCLFEVESFVNSSTRESSLTNPKGSSNPSIQNNGSNESPIENSHVAAFKEAIVKGGSLSMHLTHCVCVGMPRAGKTSLYHRLLDRTPPGQPTTHTDFGNGSDSTNVLTERKMIQVKLPSTKAVFAGDLSYWNETSTLDDEIAMFAKATYYQKMINQSFLSPIEHLNPLTSSDANSLIDNPITPTTSLIPPNADTTSEVTSTTLDLAVIDALLSHIKNGSNNIAEIQTLLDKCLTIFYTDCGGQDEFTEVMPSLLAGPAIFLLVFNLCDSLDSIADIRYESSSGSVTYAGSNIAKEVLMRFLSSIQCFHEVQSHTISQQHVAYSFSPPTNVITIGTHKDLVNDIAIEKADKTLKECIRGTKLENDGIIEFFSDDKLIIPINNFCQEDGPKVRKVFDQAICREVKGQCRYKIKLPVPWLGFDLCLRKQSSAVISYKECVEIGRKLNMIEEEVKHCLWFLHYKMGTIRYFGEVKELKDIIFTQPNMIFETVTDFITSTFTLDKVPNIVKSKFMDLGLFKKEDVESIYNKHSKNLAISFIEFIALFKHLNIIGPTHNPEYDYFLGCALAHAPIPDSKSPAVFDPLIVAFKAGFLPNGIFSGTLACLCRNNWEIKCSPNGKPLLYRYQATFIAHGHPLTMKATAKYIEFTLDYTINNSVCEFCIVQKDVKRAIEEALERLGYNSDFQFGFYCTLSECMESEKHIAAILPAECISKAKCCVTKAQFPLCQKRMLWFRATQLGVTTDVNIALFSYIENGRPEVKDMVLLLNELVNWSKFALLLPGVMMHDIEKIKVNHKDDVEEQKIAVYSKWLRSCPTACWKDVVMALEKIQENVIAKCLKKHLISLYVTSEAITHESLATSIADAEDKPNPMLDSTKLYKKSPFLEDVLVVIPLNMANCETFRKAMKIPLTGNLRTAIEIWINEEPSDVTWLNLLKSVSTSSKSTARHIATSYLRRPSVYKKYIDCIDYQSLLELGII